MTTLDCNCVHPLNRRQVLALLAALGVTGKTWAQDAPTVDPRSYRVVLENDRVRVLEYKSRPGLGVCGQGMHYHPAHLTVSLTGAKLKETTSDGKVSFPEVPPGHGVLFRGPNALGRDHRRRRYAHIHHRVEGQGLEAEHRGELASSRPDSEARTAARASGRSLTEP